MYRFIIPIIGGVIIAFIAFKYASNQKEIECNKIITGIEKKNNDIQNEIIKNKEVVRKRIIKTKDITNDDAYKLLSTFCRDCTN